MPFKNGTKLCICEICICGRHSCPHKTACPPFGKCVLSEYASRYVPHAMDGLERGKPPRSERTTYLEPMANDTTHRMDYVQHPAQKMESFRPQSGVQKIEAKMEDITQYRKEYTEKKVPRPASCHVSTRKVLPGKFEGDSSYRRDYISWNVDPAKAIRSDDKLPVSGPFQGLATYTRDYIPHGLCKREPITAHSKHHVSSQPLDDRTAYRDDYVQHVIPKKTKAKPPTVWPKPPFQGTTTNQRDYLWNAGDGRRTPCKPRDTTIASGATLDDRTTHRLDYVQWNSKPELPCKQPEYAKKYEPFDDTTCYKQSYTEHITQRTKGVKPIHRTTIGAPFQGDTNYRMDYKNWERSVPAVCRPDDSRGHFDRGLPFDGLTQYRKVFIPHKLEQNRGQKPKDSGVHATTDRLDDTTIYRQEFTPKKNEICPAGLLDLPISNYEFKEQDPVTGHKFYELKKYHALSTKVAAK